MFKIGTKFRSCYTESKYHANIF